MSRSPKYTTAYLTGAQQAELERLRRERERERERRAKEARRQREQAERAALAGELARLRADVQAGAADAVATGFADRHSVLLPQIEALAARAASAQTTSDLQTARDNLVTLQHAAHRVATAVGGVLAARERKRALAAVRESLTAVPDREELDADGGAETARLLVESESLLADPARFAAAHGRLAAAAQAHLARVHARRTERRQMREQAAAARAVVAGVLAEAREGDIALAGAAVTQDLLERLTAAAAAGDVQRARSLCAQVEQAGRQLEDDFDRQLDQLDRAKLVYQAVIQALGEVGLRLLPRTYQAAGTAVSVQAERGDGGLIEIAVVPGDADDVQIEYHADGADFVVKETADGQVPECPDTEELIEQFHGELAALEVATGELLWDGKPGTRPDRVQAKRFLQRGTRHQEHG